MSVRRMPRNRRNGFSPAVDGLEARLVLATAPTNVLAIPAQVAQINAQVVAISNSVISVVPYTLSVGGHVGAQGAQNVTNIYMTAQNDFAQLQADSAAVQQAADDQLSTLKEGKFILDSQIATNYNTEITAIFNYYNALTPAQQAAQFQQVSSVVSQVNLATQNAYKISANYYVGQENAVIGLYNQTAAQLNVAMANAANAVRLSGNLYVYVVQGSSTPTTAPIFTPLPPIKPVALTVPLTPLTPITIA